jgi:hypothetical protein
MRSGQRELISLTKEKYTKLTAYSRKYGKSAVLSGKSIIAHLFRIPIPCRNYENQARNPVPADREYYLPFPYIPGHGIRDGQKGWFERNL